ncbi:MAG: DUF2339 domain-containing protein [Hyphomonadaceae bacterium]
MGPGLTLVLIIAIATLGAAAAFLWRRAHAHGGAARMLSAQFAAPQPTLDDPLADEPLLLTEEALPEEPKGRGTLRWGLGAALLFLPAAAFLFSGASAAILMWLALVGVLAGIGAAERFGWSPAAWLAAGGAGLWSLIGVRLAYFEDASLWPAIFTALIACAGLWRMRKDGPAGFAIAIAACAAIGTACLGIGAASPYGAALAFIVLLAAIAGAVVRKLEPALALAWLLACFGLFALSGQRAAEVWLMPACVLTAALFLSIEFFSVPRLGRDGILPAATGAIAAPFAVYILYAADIAPGRDLTQAIAWLAIAVVQGAILWRAARTPGGLHELGFAIAPPALCLAASLIAAFSIGLLSLWATAPIALCAAACAWVDARARHPIWKFLAAVFLAAALFNTVRNTLLLYIGVTGADAVAFILAGIAAPALALGLSARLFSLRAPWTSAALEASALALGIVACSSSIRWIATSGAPAQAFISFSEAGAHISVWIALAAVLLLREDRGAHDVRRATAILLISVSCSFFFLANLGALNPWWGRAPDTAAGIGFFNMLLLGYAAPGAALGGLGLIAHRRHWRRTSLGLLSIAALAGLIWICLEMRRAHHGPDLSAGGVLPWESVGLSSILLAGAAALILARPWLDAAERTLAAGLAVLLLAKLIAIDLFMAPGAARTISLVLLAIAGALIALPRETRLAALRAEIEARFRRPEPVSP